MEIPAVVNRMELQFKSETMGLCRLCLSAERAMATVEEVFSAFQVLTDSAEAHWTPRTDTRVCWECLAILHKIQKFKRQVLKAQMILQNMGSAAPQTCLSHLAVNTKTFFDAELIFDVDSAGEFDDEHPENKIFDPKIEIDVADDDITLLDVWADPVDFTKEENSFDGEVIPLEIEHTEVKLEPVDESVAFVKSRRRSKTKHKHRNVKKDNDEIENILKTKVAKIKKIKVEKECSIKMQSKPKKVDTSGMCLTCGGVRRRRKRSRESRTSKEHSSRLTDIHKCTVCDLVFNDEDEVSKHRQVNHAEAAAACTCEAKEHESLLQKIKVPEKSDAGTYDCDVCGARLKSEEYFRLHYEPHISDRRFECDLCGGVYKTRTQMFRHLVVHKPPMFLCDICGKRLPKISTLKTHFLSHASLEERPHKCNICARTFITRDKLTIHVRFHDKVKPFKCKLCPYEFYVNFELTRHMKTHHCIGDGEEKAKKEKLKRTVSLCRNKRMNRDETGAQKKNSGVKPMVKQNKGRGSGNDLRCNICGKTFSQKVCLDAHIVVHTGDRPFKCEECGQAFKFQSNVLTHARSVHRVDKLHQCTVCGAQFKLKGNLTAHTKIHSGEKPFACDICDQKFIRSRNLRNHYKVHTK